MAIIRTEKNRNYTVMSNYHLRDKNLSLKAKGLMSFMLSLPDDWDFTTEGLTKFVKESRDAVRSALHELEEYGYLERYRERNGKGQVTKAIYTLHESPTGEKPKQENPTQDSTTQLNTNIPSTKETNLLRSTKEIESTRSKRRNFHKPTLEEVSAYIEENGFTFTAERFIDYYEANGWMVGHTHMKDWKATCRNWERRANDKPSYTSPKKSYREIPDWSKVDVSKGWDA